jgi:transposase InsO family protein
LRSDDGGEYTSKEFEGLCKEVGIKRELTIMYNPQQNGVAEWNNRSIIGVAKAMVHDQDLSMFLWVEACNTTVYIQNQCPHKISKDKTSVEGLTSVKPEVSHFSIFGCPFYIHVPIKKRTKLEPSNMKGLFVLKF